MGNQICIIIGLVWDRNQESALSRDWNPKAFEPSFLGSVPVSVSALFKSKGWGSWPVWLRSVHLPTEGAVLREAAGWGEEVGEASCSRKNVFGPQQEEALFMPHSFFFFPPAF